MKPTPINLAEAIFEPFWDPNLSGLKNWTIEPGETYGLVVSQNWCWVSLDWTSRPENGVALCMTCQFDLECQGYDSLIASINLPEGSHLRLEIQTDHGKLIYTSPVSIGEKQEPSFPLDGAKTIDSLTLEIHTDRQGVATGWLNWLGLQDSVSLERYLEQFNLYSAEWEGYLKPEDYSPSFTPQFGFLINGEELIDYRREHQEFLKENKIRPFSMSAQTALDLVPESMIRDFVNFWGDTRYCRVRDFGHLLLRHGPEAAIAGLILQDSQLTRLAARYALAIAFCKTWDDGMVCEFPGSTFDHRCFVQSLCTYETALILDLVGEWFTDLGRDYILRRIGEHGIGNINQIVWSYEYIFHNNQLAWFTPGRMLGYLTLEKFWPRVRAYTELALADLYESLEDTVLPDGGYVEGPTYFRCVARDGGLSLYHYARSRGKKLGEIVPPAMIRTAGFAAAIASTDTTADVIPICDGGTRMELEALSVMAVILPESPWVNIFRKALDRAGGFPTDAMVWQLKRSIPAEGSPLPDFVFLPDMGVMASVRSLDGHLIKLLLMGNKAGAGHTHEDKGSFILEFAGETFAMDPGTCDYSHPDSSLIKHCERHNMLVPTGISTRPHPLNPLPFDVKPVGQGDANAFTASIDATPGWEPYFKKWERTWVSPHAGVISIRDEYELFEGTGVDFYWNTRLPVEIQDDQVTIEGKQGRIILQAIPRCSIRVETFSIAGSDFQHRIAFHHEMPKGLLELTVLLEIKR